MVESSWLWEWYSRIKHQYNREQNQGLQLNPALHCSKNTITTAGSWLETFCSQVQLRAVYLGHKAELPAPALQPLTLCICQGCHTFLGLTKASPGHQCLLPEPPPSAAGAARPLLCTIKTRAPRGARICQNLCSISMVQRVPSQIATFQSRLTSRFSPSQPSLLCTSTWPITLFYSAKVSKTLKKLQSEYLLLNAQPCALLYFELHILVFLKNKYWCSWFFQIILNRQRRKKEVEYLGNNYKLFAIKLFCTTHWG